MKQENSVRVNRKLCLLVALALVLAQGASAAPVPGFSNTSFEEEGATPLEALGWQAFTPGLGSGYERVNNFSQAGDYSLRVVNGSDQECSGAYQRLEINQSTPKPVLLTAQIRGDNIVADPNSQLVGGGGAGLYAEIHYQEESVPADVFWNAVSSSGTFGWRQIGFNTSNIYDGNGAPLVQAAIDHIFVVPFLCQAAGTAYFDNLSADEFDPSQAAITIMFDDGEDDTFTVAKPAMDQYNFVGTSAVPSGFLGVPGYMNQDQLLGLESAGWEIVSHSVNHLDLTQLSQAELESELANSKQTLTDLGLTINNFAIPFGAYNANVMATAANYYGSARAFERGDNPQGLFPFEVKVRQIINTTSEGQVEDWLTEAADGQRWTILNFHSIAESGDDSYHTTPGDFRAFLAKIYASGLPVITYDEGLRLFDADPNNDPDIEPPGPIDVTPPLVTIVSAPSDPTNNPTPTIEFTVLDESATTAKCQVDDGEFGSCASPFTTAELSDGLHRVVIRATDANNLSGEATVEFTVDTTAPLITVTSAPANPTNNPSPVIEFSVSDASLVTTGCKIYDREADFTPCESPWQLVDLVDREYSVKIRATDAAGNLSEEVSVNCTVDTEKPVITLNGASLILTLGDTYEELGATVTDNLDSNVTAVIGGDFVNTSVVGTYDVTYNATDEAGNVALQVTRRVVVNDRESLSSGGSSRRRPAPSDKDDGPTTPGLSDGELPAGPQAENGSPFSGLFAPAIALASEFGGIDTDALAAVFTEATSTTAGPSPELAERVNSNNLAAVGAIEATDLLWILLPVLLVLGGVLLVKRVV